MLCHQRHTNKRTAPTRKGTALIINYRVWPVKGKESQTETKHATNKVLPFLVTTAQHLGQEGQKMSHYMTALAMKQKGLKPATKIVLYWLADHHNGETGECFPSINRLADVCEMSRRSVENHLETLETLGLIQRVNQFRDRGGKTSNRYLLELTGTSENDSSADTDTQNLRMVCEKSAHGHTQNLRMNNLGINNLGKETNISSSDDDGVDYYFDQLWEEYPRKVGKAQAKKAFKAASKKINFYDLLPKYMSYVLTLEGKETQFIPHLATWLNGERWNDEGK